jgi:hypothetical protein
MLVTWRLNQLDHQADGRNEELDQPVAISDCWFRLGHRHEFHCNQTCRSEGEVVHQIGQDG